MKVNKPFLNEHYSSISISENFLSYLILYFKTYEMFLSDNKKASMAVTPINLMQ